MKKQKKRAHTYIPPKIKGAKKLVAYASRKWMMNEDLHLLSEVIVKSE